MRSWRALGAALMIVAIIGLRPVSSDAQAIARGTRAPEIDLPTLAGGRVKLSALRGHPVVVTFWGSWCQACREELVELVAAHKTYRDRGLVVLAVNQRDQELNASDVQTLITEYSVQFAVALDTLGHIRRSFRLVAIPTTVFIDSAGVIQHVHSGAIDHVKLEQGLATILPPK